MIYKNLNATKKVLNLIFFKKFSSRVELSRILRLEKSTITNITKKLIEKNIIEKTSNPSYFYSNTKKVGKKRQSLKINENFKFIFGATITENSINIGLTNLKGEVISKACFNLGKDIVKQQNAIYISKLIINKTKTMLAENYISKDKILGIGVSFKKNLSKGALKCMYHLLKENISAPVYLKDLEYGLTIGEFLFFFDKYKFTGEKNMFIFAGKQITATILRKEKIYTSCKIYETKIGDVLLKEDRTTINILYKSIKNEIAQNNKKDIHIIIKKFCEYFANMLHNYNKIAAIQNIKIFGEFFLNKKYNDHFNKLLAQCLPKDIENICENSRISKDNIFLAGCAICLNFKFLDFLD